RWAVARTTARRRASARSARRGRPHPRARARPRAPRAGSCRRCPRGSGCRASCGPRHRRRRTRRPRCRPDHRRAQTRPRRRAPACPRARARRSRRRFARSPRARPPRARRRSAPTPRRAAATATRRARPRLPRSRSTRTRPARGGSLHLLPTRAHGRHSSATRLTEVMLDARRRLLYQRRQEEDHDPHPRDRRRRARAGARRRLGAAPRREVAQLKPRTVRDDRGPLRGTRAEEESFMKRIAIVWTAALVGCVGCASASYRVAHVELDPAKYEQLGYAEGDATWVLILNIIPFGRPDQIHRAMEDAIQSKHGEEIVDVTIEESWFLNGFSVH